MGKGMGNKKLQRIILTKNAESIFQRIMSAFSNSLESSVLLSMKRPETRAGLYELVDAGFIMVTDSTGWTARVRLLELSDSYSRGEVTIIEVEDK